ncbi:MAG: hypothetical protein L3J23_08980 [Flavobacteriaceae bacterium]|nr:hypothetical protein [Flavobacteriaceae bacterium]
MAHELWHAWENWLNINMLKKVWIPKNGLIPKILKKELTASQFENKIRVEHNIPKRKWYGYTIDNGIKIGYGKIFYFLFLLIISCCPYKVTKYEKQRWDEKIQQEYEFPKREIPNIKVVKILEFGIEAAIFPKFYTMGRGKEIGNYYTPNISDIIEAENLILQYNIKDSISLYYDDFNKRQYLGYFTENNDKILEINYLKIETKCQEKSDNGYLFNKFFFTIYHPDEESQSFSLMLSNN